MAKICIKIRHWVVVCVATVLVFAGMGIIYLFRHFINIERKIACGSQLSSIGAFLEDNEQNEKIRSITTGFSKQWRLLNESEYAKLISTLRERGRSIDLGGMHPDPNNVLLDHWGRRIVIAGRKAENGKPEFILWSKGPDGVLGSENDLSCPWGVPFPIELIEK